MFIVGGVARLTDHVRYLARASFDCAIGARHLVFLVVFLSLLDSKGSLGPGDALTRRLEVLLFSMLLGKSRGGGTRRTVACEYVGREGEG